MDFPDHPFWDFSLALYAKPGVAESCLRLQDGLGLDVNLLLYACWTAAKGAGRLSPDGWRRLVDETAPWRAQVVEPLRRVRRFLKGAEESPWSAGLRERVKALELDAEHAQQLAIAALAGPGGAAAADAQEPICAIDREDNQSRSALAAMLDYVGAVDIALSDANRSDLWVIASQVIGDTDKL
jgi:uncharacterized protein (TIGR02444 family)